jgi:hypothetical protein
MLIRYVRFGSIVLKKSPPNTSEPFPRNNDSIATYILNHRCVTKVRRDRKLRAKHALRLFQHNRSKVAVASSEGAHETPKKPPIAEKYVVHKPLEAIVFIVLFEGQ